MPLDPVSIRRIAEAEGYLPTTLEKVARLEGILGEIARHAEFGDRLVLKGGTAINFVLLSDAPRLSVDIDLNYVGSIAREDMLRDRERVEGFIERVISMQGYQGTKRAPYGVTGWDLRYANVAGNVDIIKVEVNWLLRIPIWAPERVPFRSVFTGEPVHVTAAAREEIVAGKLAALIDRAAPRDLFDVATLAEHHAMGDAERLKSATVLLASFHAEDARDRLNDPGIGDVDEREIRNVLWPTLRRDRRPARDVLKASCLAVVREVMTLGEKEKLYLGEFYERGRFDPAALFEGMGADPRLPDHPMATWRLQRMGFADEG